MAKAITMTTTAIDWSTPVDWDAVRFAVTTRLVEPDMGTCLVGHMDPECSAIDYENIGRDCVNPDSWYTPWPCPTCVHTPKRASHLNEEPGATDKLSPRRGPDDVRPSGGTPASPITSAQAGYIAKLVPSYVVPERCTKLQASKIIKALLEARTPQGQGNECPNRYPGDCQLCQRLVPAEAGHLLGYGGKWVVRHKEGQCPRGITSAPSQPRQATDLGVPAGRYAVTAEGGQTVFFKVDRPDEGRWKGYTFVKVMASDEEHPVRGKARDTVLAQIRAAGVKEAMLRYGKEIGHCGHCGRTLTDKTSRALGIGPVCRAGLGW